jgi:EAL domain-containing protein (putative c-di-GMP-specific phosphodiesterase class I)
VRVLAPDPLADALDRLIEQRSFDLHFQPLVAIDRAEIYGFEALTRAPADGPLQSPLVLFDAAARLGRLVELEHLIVRRAIQRFKALGLPGQLFLNVTADTLLGARAHAAQLAAELAELGLQTSRVVIELTETRPVEDMARLDDALQALRERGFRVALDDLGEGFASLRRWMQMRPDFVKIDRHFINGIAQEPGDARMAPVGRAGAMRASPSSSSCAASSRWPPPAAARSSPKVWSRSRTWTCCAAWACRSARAICSRGRARRRAPR